MVTSATAAPSWLRMGKQSELRGVWDDKDTSQLLLKVLGEVSLSCAGAEIILATGGNRKWLNWQQHVEPPRET